MSRSGYSDDCDGGNIDLWRGAVNAAIKGKRGQAFLREMLAALEAMPNKELIREALFEDGQVCAIGSVGLARGLDMHDLDPQDWASVAMEFGIAPALVREISFENDDDWVYSPVTPFNRWQHMVAWVKAQLRKT